MHFKVYDAFYSQFCITNCFCRYCGHLKAEIVLLSFAM